VSHKRLKNTGIEKSVKIDDYMDRLLIKKGRGHFKYLLSKDGFTQIIVQKGIHIDNGKANLHTFSW